MIRLGESPIKRIFGYFLGASKKLPAQQSGKNFRNTKRLNGNEEAKFEEHFEQSVLHRDVTGKQPRPHLYCSVVYAFSLVLSG